MENIYDIFYKHQYIVTLHDFSISLEVDDAHQR